MISYYYKTRQNERLQNLSSYRPNCWMSAVNPTDDEISMLDTKLGLDENLIRDALDPFEVPRIETEDEKIYFFTRFISKDEKMLSAIPILIVIDKNCLLTVSTHEFPLFEKLSKKLVDEGTSDRIIVVAKMLFVIMREYHKLILDLSKHVQSVNANLADIQNADIVKLVTFENMFHDLLSSLIPTHIALGQLATGKYRMLSETESELLVDSHLFINQLIEMCKTNIERVVNIREATDTILSHRLNTTMKFLAGMTLIFTIPTMIFSFFGMNVRLPLEDMEMAHMIIVWFAGGLSLLLLLLFAKKRLL